MGKILLKNIRVYSHHGCLKEETVIGSNYRVDLSVKADLRLSAQSDKLKDTVDYVLLNRIVKEEMAIPSKLLEHVAQRILNRIFQSSNMVKRACISVSKINPPIGGDVEQVSVSLKRSKK